MLTEKQYGQIRKELAECTRPLFFFHDDADGLCSFLLLYRYIKEGKGICVKSTPKVDMKFYRKVEEYSPDKIFVVDLAMVDQDFIDACKVPIIWIDHHEPLKRSKVKYFNPRVNDADDNQPASYLCYRAVKQDMWIAMLGCVGDWYLPDFTKEFSQQYPDLLDKRINKPEAALFDSKLGELVKMISFLLKGKISDVNKCVKIMTRIDNPYDYFNTDLPPIKFLLKRYERFKKTYDVLLESALKKKTKDKLYVFTYYDDKVSLTKELSNELLYMMPNKLIILCREKSGEMKCSLRCGKLLLPPILQKSLFGLEGHGGGHEHACGAVVNKEDFKHFIDNIRDEIK